MSEPEWTCDFTLTEKFQGKCDLGSKRNPDLKQLNGCVEANRTGDAVTTVNADCINDVRKRFSYTFLL